MLSDVVQLERMYGRIASPDFPNVYPNSKERTWNITVPRGYAIRIYFTHFKLELSYQCEYDYVKVCEVCLHVCWGGLICFSSLAHKQTL